MTIDSAVDVTCEVMSSAALSGCLINDAECYFKSPLGIIDIVASSLAVIFNSLYLYVRVIKKKDVESNIPTVMLSFVNLVLVITVHIYPIVLTFHPAGSFQITYVAAGNAFGYCWQILLLFCVSIDRYIGIMKPLHYHQIITKKRVIIIAVVSAVIATMVSILVIFIPSRPVAEYAEIGINATLTLRMVNSDELLLFWQIMFVPFVLIFLTMCGFYFAIILVIRKQLKNSNATLKEYKGTFILIACMVYFLITYLPLFLINTIPQFLDLPLSAPALTSSLFMMNVCVLSSGFVNSLLYGVASKTFWTTLGSGCHAKNKVSTLEHTISV